MVNVVSLFSGCGGSSLGYVRAGCKILFASDFESRAIQTYRLNFPNTFLLQENIRNLTKESILSHIKNMKIDILDGSPPCTPFSMSGLREKGWGKEYKHSSETKKQRTDDLFIEFIRLIKELKPKTFIAENVAGLVRGSAKQYYNNIISNMKALGYSIFPFLLDAKYFEVAQSRVRVIIIGIRQDIKQNVNARLKRKLPPITFMQAVRNLKNSEQELKYAHTLSNSILHTTTYYLEPGKDFGNIYQNGRHFNYSKATLYAPLRTLTTHTMIIHPTEQRWLTLGELKRCSSYPDDFKFLSIHDGMTRIGNSVPPNFMKNIALYVIEKANLI